jgi:hypothetical protein
MTKNLIILALISSCIVFPACKSSYSKDNIPASIEKIIKKEYNLEGHAKLAGDTVYLQVQLDGLVSTEEEALAEIYKKVQGASLAVTRVALSSDANIRILVILVSEPTYKLNLRIIERVEDIKAYLYMKISRNDYQERLILEIEKSDDNIENIDSEIDENKSLDNKEFAGRLIVSQINMLSRSNPFLGAMIGNAQLKYISFDGEELVAGISNNISQPSMSFFTDIVNAQALKIRNKNICPGPKRVKIIDSDNNYTFVQVVQRPAQNKNTSNYKVKKKTQPPKKTSKLLSF